MTNMRELKRLERVVYHEAGHALAAYLVNLRFTKVSMIQRDDLLDRCSFTKWPKNFYPERNRSPRTRSLVEKEVTTIVAGHLAENLLAGQTEWNSSHHDIVMARKILDKLCSTDEEVDAYLNWLWVRTKNQLQLPLNWMMVEALSTALMEHQELDGQMARSIFQETQKTWMTFLSRAKET